MQQAQEVFQLQSFVDQLDLSQSTQELATAVASSPEVGGILNSTRNFYPIAYGIKEAGIYQDWCVYYCCTPYYVSPADHHLG
jgi:hypothetical protein